MIQRMIILRTLFNVSENESTFKVAVLNLGDSPEHLQK